MPGLGTTLSFQPIHIDVARNATDDFNPFHDKNRWHRITDNPFSGPIALGFQLECLIENQLHKHRGQQGENDLISAESLRYSNYEFKFVNAVLPGQDLSISIKDSQFKTGDNPTLGNRVSLRADGKLALAGYKRESNTPLCPATIDLTGLGNLDKAEDRAFFEDTDLFLKRKYIMTSNAKNFLSGSLVEQSEYIDELDERINFPEIFPCALLSCALLERAWQQGHDFEREPMVYRSHNISIDREYLQELRSNDALHLLSRHADPVAQTPVYDCFGVIGTERLLFSARIGLMPLASGQP
jgi:hypothetical protein